MGLGLECIPEEDEKVELAARDHRPDLLIATEGTALKLHDRKIQFAREQGACRAGRVQLVIGERVGRGSSCLNSSIGASSTASAAVGNFLRITFDLGSSGTSASTALWE